MPDGRRDSRPNTFNEAPRIAEAIGMSRYAFILLIPLVFAVAAPAERPPAKSVGPVETFGAESADQLRVVGRVVYFGRTP